MIRRQRWSRRSDSVVWSAAFVSRIERWDKQRHRTGTVEGQRGDVTEAKSIAAADSLGSDSGGTRCRLDADRSTLTLYAPVTLRVVRSRL